MHVKLEETTGKKSKVLETTEGHQMRGFTATQLPKRGAVVKTGQYDIVLWGNLPGKLQ